MPNPPDSYSLVYMKTIPPSASWSGKIQYQFPCRDEKKSTSEVDAFRFPVSLGTFWINFRVVRFSSTGILRTEPLLVRLMIRTAEGVEQDLISWRKYTPNQWWSCRWPIPSFPCGENGIWLEVQQDADKRESLRVELQGFEGMYEGSAHYILVDEEDRHRFLFQYQEEVRAGGAGGAGRAGVPIGSIHDLFDENLPATHGVSPLEVEGVALFPLGAKIQRVDH